MPLEDVTNIRSPKERSSSQRDDQCKFHLRGPPITTGRGPPITADRGPPITADRGPPITADRGPPITADRGPPITAGRGPPITADRGPPITAGRGPPITAGTSVSVKPNQNSRNQTEKSSVCHGKGKNIIPSSHRNNEGNSFVPSRVNALMVQPTAGQQGTREQVQFCAGEQLKLSGSEHLTGEVRSGKRLSSESDLDPSKKMRLGEGR